MNGVALCGLKLPVARAFGLSWARKNNGTLSGTLKLTDALHPPAIRPTLRAESAEMLSGARNSSDLACG